MQLKRSIPRNCDFLCGILFSMSKNASSFKVTYELQPTLRQKWILRKMDTFSGGLRSINEWCSAHDEIDLGLTWGVIKYLHWETKWLIDSMTCEDFLEF